MDKREEAKTILKYYFYGIARKSGITWGSDNDAEIDAAVDMIIDSAREERN